MRSLGHGHHAAHQRVRRVNLQLSNLTPGDRQLYASRLWRLPIARSQQRSEGARRYRCGAECLSPAIKASPIPKSASASRRAQGVKRAAPTRAWITTRWWRLSTKAKLRAMWVCRRRHGKDLGWLQFEASWAAAMKSSTYLWCRTFSSAKPAATPTSCYPVLRRSKRRGPLPAPNDGFSGCIRRLPELGGSRADWKITQDIYQHMGANWNYQHPSGDYGRASLAHATVRPASSLRSARERYKTLQWPVASGSDLTRRSSISTASLSRMRKQDSIQFRLHEPTERQVATSTSSSTMDVF